LAIIMGQYLHVLCKLAVHWRWLPFGTVWSNSLLRYAVSKGDISQATNYIS